MTQTNNETNREFIPFLKLVANDLLEKVGNDLSRVAVVFPNKRASLFFNDYLADSQKPVWAPRYITISELFAEMSAQSVADPIYTVCKMYQIYVDLTHSDETLDFFYGWGEKLLADFDDADKNMVDTQKLFQNLSEIKALEDGGFINSEQEEVLRDFFKNFSASDNSLLKHRFLALWNQMNPIYTRLSAELANENLAYEGRLYRNVVEALEDKSVELPKGITTYAFVGFNVLDKVEERLFAHIMKEGKALFYWDYDTYYTGQRTDMEAGVFIRRNLSNFPNELPEKFFNNFANTDKQIEFASAATASIQAMSASSWLEKNITPDEKRTAIVLCDENLLQPVLHAIPPAIKQINVTKGFPLSHTPAFSLFETYFDELGDTPEGNTSEALHGLAKKIKAEARKPFNMSGVEYKETEILGQLFAESYFQAYTITNRLIGLVDAGKLSISITTLVRLLRQILRRASIPFHGEPAVGLQVMGVLETRNLDFENILMLSVNEGSLPQKANDNSFIPYNLRRQFGMTTSKHKTAVYAYYFYRLLQRAKRIRLVYNNASERGKQKGEMSRFMTQLLVESPHNINHIALAGSLSISSSPLESIAKPADMMDRIGALSPSALNSYMRCQLEFFFNFVARLRLPDPQPDVIEPNTFGTLFHQAAEFVYKDILENNKGIVSASVLRPFLSKDGGILIDRYVRKSFEHCKMELNPIVLAVLCRYLRQLIKNDSKIVEAEEAETRGNAFEVIATEGTYRKEIKVDCGGNTLDVNLKGTIDRLDLVNIDGVTTLRVVDYKTGGQIEKADDVEQLFDDNDKRPHYIFQTFFYSYLLTDKYKYPIAPALFFVHRAAGNDYTPYIEFGKVKCHDIRPFAEDFEKCLKSLIADIFDTSKPFQATTYRKNCANCNFKILCKR